MTSDGGRRVLKIVYCNPLTYDLAGLILAVATCFSVSLLACELLGRAVTADGRARAMWLWGTAITAGTGFWSTHFIALLSYRPGVQMAYDPVLTLLAWVATILGTGVSLGLLANAATWRGRFVGGAMLGLAQAATHFVGISALRTQGYLVWDGLLATLAHLAPVLILGVGVVFVTHLDTWQARARGAALLTVSILVLHFSGMAAMRILPDLRVVVGQGLVSAPALTMALAMILTLSISMSVMALAVRERGDVEALHRLREVIDAMPAGLAYYDARNRMVVCNTQYADMVGLGEHVLKPGLHFREILQLRAQTGQHPDAIGREAAWVQERIDLRRTPGVPFEQLNLGHWLRIVERRTSDGGVICVSLDVTDLKTNAQRLALALEETELANKAKDEFLTNMSHEVRTPLNGVIGLADMLSRTTLMPPQRDMLASLQRSAGGLSQMMVSLIDFVSLNTGRFEIHRAPFDVQVMLSEAAAPYAFAAQAKGVALTQVDHTGGAHLAVGDRSRIQQVLASLIDNAVKFTTHGAVAIEATTTHEDGEDLLVITVADTGIGFDAATAAVLFEKFEQADGSMTRRFGGTGLGLSVAHKLTHLMSGALTAQAQPGQGATFRMAVPVTWTDRGATAKPAVTPEAPSAPIGHTPPLPAHRLRVLLADDHPTNRQVVELIMTIINAEVVSVEDGAQAVEAFRLAPYDIVLMDLQMPVMDGLTAMRLIRAWEVERAMARTPMMALTANVLPIHVTESLEAGATSHLGKPVTADKLLNAVRETIAMEKLVQEERLAG
jgi:signal transduction histidine kinase/NO-binding membrane sensor protein with MHYT domain/AmiR/NasT family two-component response regulator